MTKKEILNYVSKINDKDLLQEIENVIFRKDLENILSDIFDNKMIPSKAKKSITNFFILDKATFSNKVEVINAIKEGMIIELKPGKYNSILDLIDNKFKNIKSTDLFKRLLDFVYPLTDAKDKQGATGTGRGEIMLALIGKNGRLPDKSDAEINSKGIEVKASNGEIAGFKKVTPTEVKKDLEQYFGKIAEKDPKNFSEICKILVNKDEKTAKKFLINHFLYRVTENYLKKPIEIGIQNAVFDKKYQNLQKNILNSVGTEVFLAYKKLYKFDYILVFKDSKSALTNISIASTRTNFLKSIKINGMNMTNGGRPAPITVNVL